MTPSQIKAQFIKTLAHVESIALKLDQHTGKGKTFNFSDQHKFLEGLLLTCWTHWEEFIREVLVADLATLKDGRVWRDVKKFRVKGAPWRLAEAVLSHPDHPDKFVEWDFNSVKSRADTFLPASHRFNTHLARRSDLELLKRIRNAIAHKSDKAWEGFLKLVKAAPFSLGSRQRQGITVGRFLAAHKWNNQPTLTESIAVLKDCANTLVP